MKNAPVKEIYKNFSISHYTFQSLKLCQPFYIFKTFALIICLCPPLSSGLHRFPEHSKFSGRAHALSYHHQTLLWAHLLIPKAKQHAAMAYRAENCSPRRCCLPPLFIRNAITPHWWKWGIVVQFLPAPPAFHPNLPPVGLPTDTAHIVLTDTQSTSFNLF